ncbi:MAG TPA: helix-turn-helix domain-containing protein [Thermoanaerobaculia bacterium]|jgi:transcriptional regulator with XRE-family HTH domain|nr:helix-turn-helix domain-containing protein [Thermoanaerobaculia bacterium]
MDEKRDAPSAVIVRVARALAGLPQGELAERASMYPSQISDYERGEVTPEPAQLERIAVGARRPLRFLESVVQADRELAGREGGNFGPDLLPEFGPELGPEAGRRAAAAMAPALSGLRGATAEPAEPCAEDRPAGLALWRRLEPRSADERRLLVETLPSFRSWPLVEILCDVSENEASAAAREALDLARLAVQVAERVPGGEGWRERVAGYAGVFLANAIRVANQPLSAELTLRRAREQFDRGAADDPGLLSEVRVLDREASLFKDQRKFRQALEHHDRALALEGEGPLRGRLLLNRASTLEQKGDPEAAVATLREAAPLIDASDEIRPRCVLRFNLATNLLHLDRPAEAEALLPEIRSLAGELGNDLDHLRVDWLEAWICAASGRTAEALALYPAVRRAFADRDLALDAALVGLEEAALLLGQGRGAEVRTMVFEMRKTFESEQLHREAHVALKLFLDAVGQDTATAALARQAARDLSRRPHDPIG